MRRRPPRAPRRAAPLTFLLALLAAGMAIAAVVAVIVAIGAFFAAGKLPCGASATPAPASGGGRPNASFLVAAACDRNGQTGFRRAGTGAGGFSFGGPGSVAGTLQSVSGSTLTIQGRTGTQKVTLDGATRIRRYATGSKSDLKTGDTVIVSGGQSGAPRTVTVLPAGQGQQ